MPHRSKMRRNRKDQREWDKEQARQAHRSDSKASSGRITSSGSMWMHKCRNGSVAYLGVNQRACGLCGAIRPEVTDG
jgi:hypothetical protein